MIAGSWRGVGKVEDADANYLCDTGFAEYAETLGNAAPGMLRRARSTSTPSRLTC